MLQQALNQKKYAARKDESRVGVYEQERRGELLHTYQQEKEGVQFLGEKKFILTRFAGHKRTMPNGERWRLHTQSGHGSAGCWICDKWAYTLFFWTRAFGVKDRPKLTSAALVEFEERRRALEHY